MKKETMDTIADIMVLAVGFTMAATVFFMMAVLIDMYEYQNTGSCDRCMVLPLIIGDVK